MTFSIFDFRFSIVRGERGFTPKAVCFAALGASENFAEAPARFRRGASGNLPEASLLDGGLRKRRRRDGMGTTEDAEYTEDRMCFAHQRE